MAVPTTKGLLYIVNLTTLDRLEIQFVPNNLPLGRRANYEGIQIVGRNLPHLQFSGGQSQMTLELDFLAEQENRLDVIDKVAWLEALAASNGYDNPPPEVSLIWGILFKNKRWVVTSVQPVYDEFSQDVLMLPRHAKVSITFAEVSAKNLKWNDIRRV